MMIILYWMLSLCRRPDLKVIDAHAFSLHEAIYSDFRLFVAGKLAHLFAPAAFDINIGKATH